MAQCGIFIDGGYLTKVLENDFGRPHLDYENLVNKLAFGNGARLRTYYYDCMPHQSNPSTPDESRKYSNKAKFIHAITRKIQRFEFRQGKIRKSASGRFEQKRVDVLLAIDMVRLCSKRQISTVILVAGDSDLVPAVTACKIEGAIVKLYYANRSVSDELINVCDERYVIDTQFISEACTASYPHS